MHSKVKNVQLELLHSLKLGLMTSCLHGHRGVRTRTCSSPSLSCVCWRCVLCRQCDKSGNMEGLSVERQEIVPTLMAVHGINDVKFAH